MARIMNDRKNENGERGRNEFIKGQRQQRAVEI